MVSKNKKGRPEKLTKERQGCVTRIFQANLDVRIKKIYDMAVSEWEPAIKKEIRKQYPDIKQVQLNMAVAEELPGYDTVRNYYNNVLKPNAEMQRDNPLDKPWSLGSMNKPDIPPEILPVVLQVWREQLNWIEPLTVRQARWVVRLCTTIPNDVVLLIHWAQLYALWERMCSLSSIDFDSSAFDAALVMRPWELITAILTDAIKPDEGFGMLPIDELLRLSNETCVDTREEIDHVCLLWQNYFMKGSRWCNLNEKTQHEIRMRLRKWALHCPWIEDGEWLQRYIDKDLSREDLDNNPLFKPTELLKVVGY